MLRFTLTTVILFVRLFALSPYPGGVKLGVPDFAARHVEKPWYFHGFFACSVIAARPPAYIHYGGLWVIRKPASSLYCLPLRKKFLLRSHASSLRLLLIIAGDV